MTKTRVLTAGLLASALLIAPMPSAFADGPRWSKNSSHNASAYQGGSRGPVWHGGGYRGPAWHGGGGGYWRGGVWWPFAAVGAVVGTAAAIVAAPFVAFGNAVASAPYYAPQPQYYAPQPQYYAPQPQYYAPQGYVAPQPQYYAPQGYVAPQQPDYAPQGYNAPPPNYTPRQAYYAPQDYNAQPLYGDATPPPDYSAQRAPPQYYNDARPGQGSAPPPQRSYSPPTYNAPVNYPPVSTSYQRPQPAPLYYSYNN